MEAKLCCSKEKIKMHFLVAQIVKRILSAMQEPAFDPWVRRRSSGGKGMATHSLVFSLGGFHGRKEAQQGYSLWGHKVRCN